MVCQDIVCCYCRLAQRGGLPADTVAAAALAQAVALAGGGGVAPQGTGRVEAALPSQTLAVVLGVAVPGGRHKHTHILRQRIGNQAVRERNFNSPPGPGPHRTAPPFTLVE